MNHKFDVPHHCPLFDKPKVRPITFDNCKTKQGRFFIARHTYRPYNLGWGTSKADAVRDLRLKDQVWGRYRMGF
jgi:hypothetical protein